MTNFFDEASLKHESGLPVIELQISKKGKNSDEYINMFKELNAYVDKTENSANPTEYIFWFNYELTNTLVEMADPDGLSEAGTLYSYVTSHSNLRPLYVTASTTSLMSSIYSDTVELKGTFSEQQAQYFVNRINNSSRFTYSDINIIVVMNLQTKIMLIVLASILLVLIVTIIFAFVTYFGLLGMIASAVFLLISWVMFWVVASTGILITGLGLVALGVTIASSALLTFVVVNTYKNNNEEKFTSVNKVGSDKLKEIHSLLFIPVVSIVLIFYVSGLIVSTLIAIPLYLIVIGMVISYLFVSALLIPSLFVLDILLEWTRFEYTKSWDFMIGFNKEGANASKNLSANDSSDIKKKSMIGTIVAVVMLLLSVIVGGTLYGTTGSAFNSTAYGRENYSYVVQATNDQAWMNLEEWNSQTTGDRGADMVEDYYKETTKATSDIEKVFESNGVKVTSIEVVRVDEIEIDNNTSKHNLYGSFGFEIYSNDAINKDIATEIQTDLDAMAPVDLLPEDLVLEAKTNYELTERMSWDGTTSTKMIGYTENSTFMTSVYALIIMTIVLAIISLVIGNLGVAFASLLTTLMEAVLIISPLVLLYIPISTIVLFPILLLAGMSFVIKTLIIKQAKSDEIESNKWERAANKNKFIMPIFAGILLAFELLLFGIYSFIAIVPMLVVTIIAPITIYLIQQFVFPFLASNLDASRVEKAKKQLERDIEDSKNPKDGEPREEYIEGVNM